MVAYLLAHHCTSWIPERTLFQTFQSHENRNFVMPYLYTTAAERLQSLCEYLRNPMTDRSLTYSPQCELRLWRPTSTTARCSPNIVIVRNEGRKHILKLHTRFFPPSFPKSPMSAHGLSECFRKPQTLACQAVRFLQTASFVPLNVRVLYSQL